MKMRYWDGRDLDVGGYRETPDLGESFHTLIFSFHDLVRMRREDLEPVMEWVDDEELGLALRGADAILVDKVYSVLSLPRVRRVRLALERGGSPDGDPEVQIKAARELIVSVIRRL